MPIYEYECEKCGHRFEKIRKFSDAPLDTCEKCGGPVHKMQSAPAFQFKGTGWYVTDYAKSGKTGTEEKKDAKTEDKKDEKKTEVAKSDAASSTSTSSSSSTKSGD
jgi:putative FmdB family regulatory protein